MLSTGKAHGGRLLARIDAHQLDMLTTQVREPALAVELGLG